MNELKLKDVNKTEDGVKSTTFENEFYFVTFNLNKKNDLNVNVVSKGFFYPSINVFSGNEVTVNIPATGSKIISEVKKTVFEIENAIETASQIESLMKHYIF